ncbi:DUF4179 domain-containing protein [Clostridium lundense]|uniref:DUF4179 domain-containing protein n=1 Tax=Clostridium lundense TaxID=319475 RepID=UPI0004820B17|nr:DUF4179 domain-containing protein [Clostridium lundense]
MDYNLVDKKIKDKAKEDIWTLPESLGKKINDTLNNLPQKTKKNKFKKSIAVAMIAIGAVTLFSITMPSYAKNIPILGPALKYFNIGDGYEKIADKFGVCKESNGVKVTIDSAIYDGYELLVLYTVESDKPLKEAPRICSDGLITVGEKTGILSLNKNKSIASFSNEYGEFKEGNTEYSGAVTFKVASDSFETDKKLKKLEEVIDDHKIDPAKIPDKYNLSLNIDKLGGEDKKILGKWSFNLPIASEKAKGNVKEIEINKNFGGTISNTRLEKIIITPIRLYIQGVMDNDIMQFILVNDKGETLKPTGGETMGFLPGNKGSSTNMNRYIHGYEKIDKNTKHITVIPCAMKNSDKFPKIPLKLKGETKVPIAPNKYLIITKVEERNGKTYVYYKSQYPINDYLPFYLVDDFNNLYVRDIDKSITNNKHSESVLIYNEPLLDKNLKVLNDSIIYYDNAITVQLNK